MLEGKIDIEDSKDHNGVLYLMAQYFHDRMEKGVEVARELDILDEKGHVEVLHESDQT